MSGLRRLAESLPGYGELLAQFQFELANAFADRRLGQVQAFGGERKGFELGDGEKGMDLRELHSRRLLNL